MKKSTTTLFITALISGVFLTSCCQNKEKEAAEVIITEKEVIIEKSERELTAQKNTEIVLNFYQKMFGDKDLTAVDEYIDAKYIQHNPNVADGAAAFKEAAKGWFEGAEKTKINVQRTAAEGDLVFIHLKNVNPDGSLKSTIDIFRLENGKIIEHWDVHQDVPEKAANEHPMF